MIIESTGVKIDQMLASAKRRSGHPYRNVGFFSWMQTFPDISCGFSDGGGCAMTTIQSFAFLIGHDVLIYHDHRFAYRICNADIDTLFSVWKDFPGLQDVKRGEHSLGVVTYE